MGHYGETPRPLPTALAPRRRCDAGRVRRLTLVPFELGGGGEGEAEVELFEHILIVLGSEHDGEGLRWREVTQVGRPAPFELLVVHLRRAAGLELASRVEVSREERGLEEQAMDSHRCHCSNGP